MTQRSVASTVDSTVNGSVVEDRSSKSKTIDSLVGFVVESPGAEEQVVVPLPVITMPSTNNSDDDNNVNGKERVHEEEEPPSWVQPMMEQFAKTLNDTLAANNDTLVKTLNDTLVKTLNDALAETLPLLIANAMAKPGGSPTSKTGSNTTVECQSKMEYASTKLINDENAKDIFNAFGVPSVLTTAANRALCDPSISHCGAGESNDNKNEQLPSDYSVSGSRLTTPHLPPLPDLLNEEDSGASSDGLEDLNLVNNSNNTIAAVSPTLTPPPLTNADIFGLYETGFNYSN